jgi:hypothetical protein
MTDQTESPEHRACRTRTPEEDLAVKAAQFRHAMRKLGESLSSLGRFRVTPVPTAEEFTAAFRGVGE